MAAFKPLPSITGPGDCTATDVVELDAVFVADRHRITLSPAATMRCSMAEAVTHWIRDDVAPTVAALGKSLRGVETLDSFDCRRRNGIADAKISEHGRANALDVRAFKLANGAAIELTDASADKSLREKLRQTACSRFSTVLVTAPMPITIVTSISICLSGVTTIGFVNGMYLISLRRPRLPPRRL